MKRIIRTVCNIVTAATMLYIIGLAGASDADAISIDQLLIRVTVSLIVLLVATVIKEKECTAYQA